MHQIRAGKMMTGTFVAVVGASGVGKDSVLTGAKERLDGDPRFVFPRRYITRPGNAGGEDHHAVSQDEFRWKREAGGMCLWWNAHGLLYGISSGVMDHLARGRIVSCNLSRATVRDAAEIFSRMAVFEITAAPEVIAERLRARGRETADAIAARQRRKVSDWVADVEYHAIANNGAIDDAVEAFIRAILSLSDQTAQLA